MGRVGERRTRPQLAVVLAIGGMLAALVGLVRSPDAAAAPGELTMVVDAAGPYAPGERIVVSLRAPAGDGPGAGLRVARISQCATGSDVCEFRTFAAVGEGDVARTAEVTVRRHLSTALGGADCARQSCELRAVAEWGEARAVVSISVDPATTVETPSLTVDPAADLADHDVVAVIGDGFEPHALVHAAQCTLQVCGQARETVQADETGALSMPLLLPVTRTLGATDCAAGGCFVLAIADGNADHARVLGLAFDPDVPPVPAAAVEVRPDAGLLDAQVVTVSGTGFVPGGHVQIDQCVVDDAGVATACAGIDWAVADDDGEFLVEVAVRRRVQADDCAVAECALVVAGALDRLVVPVDFDGELPPPPLPVLTVSPASGLVDHQEVEVAVSDLTLFEYVDIRQCTADLVSCRSSRSVMVEALPWRTTTPVVRDLAEHDCAVVDCVMVVVRHGAGSMSLTAPLSFDPEAPRADPPTLRALPSTGLWDGQRVELAITGLLADEGFAVAQCPLGIEWLDECGAPQYHFSAAGSPERPTFVVRETVTVGNGDESRSHNCRSVDCRLVVFDLGHRPLAEIPLTFVESSAAVGGYPAQLECVAWPTDDWPEGPVPDGVDPVALQAAVDRMLGTDTDAVVVIHGGRLVAEGYDRAMAVDSINYSASVSKTFTGTVIGMLVDEGLLELDTPAPVPEWSDPTDPRHDITLRHLMNMAAGLEWNESYDFGGDNDILTMIGSHDAAAYAADKPLEVTPGTRFEYSTGTTQILAGIISRTLDRYGDELRDELDRRLFDVLGIEEDLALDGQGAWLGGVATSMTTRDYARFGLLHLRGGVWEEQQLVSTDWMRFMHEASPASAGYAGQIWRRGGFVEMVGLYGQKVTVRPDLDLVVASNTPVGGGGAGTGEIVGLFEAAAPPSCTDEPVLRDDEAATIATVPVTIDVLADDPGRGAALRPDTLTVADLPLHGTAEVVDGMVVYTPQAGFSGVEVFSYLVCTDAPYCGRATVTVTVESWGIELGHADAVVQGSSLQVSVRAPGAPHGADLTPLDARSMAIDCDTHEAVTDAVPAVVEASISAGVMAVRWITDASPDIGWDGCRRLALSFADGTTHPVDVIVLRP